MTDDVIDFKYNTKPVFFSCLTYRHCLSIQSNQFHVIRLNQLTTIKCNNLTNTASHKIFA